MLVDHGTESSSWRTTTTIATAGHVGRLGREEEAGHIVLLLPPLLVVGIGGGSRSADRRGNGGVHVGAVGLDKSGEGIANAVAIAAAAAQHHGEGMLVEGWSWRFGWNNGLRFGTAAAAVPRLGAAAGAAATTTGGLGGLLPRPGR